MSRLLSLTKAVFLGYLRDRTALFLTIVFPLVFLVIFGGIFKSSGFASVKLLEVGRVPIIDQLPPSAKAKIGKTLTIVRVSTLGGALTEVKNGTDAGVVQQVNNRLVLRYSAANTAAADTVVGVMSSLVQGQNLAALRSPLKYTLDSRAVENDALKPIQYITPGLLGWAIAVGATSGAATTLVTWRQKKILRRLALAPIRVRSIVGARIAVALLVALVQTSLFISVASLPAFGLNLSHSWWLVFPLVLAGTFAFLSIGLLLGAKSKSIQAATTAASMITIPMAFLSGSFVPLSDSPTWIQHIAKFLPLYHLDNGMLDVMVRGEAAGAILPEMGTLLGFALAASALAAALFRWDDI